jgi:hypothetical protein
MVAKPTKKRGRNMYRNITAPAEYKTIEKEKL